MPGAAENGLHAHPVIYLCLQFMLFYISSANHNYKKKSFLGMYSKHKIKDTSTHRDMFLSHNLRGKNAKYNETIE